MKKRLLRIVICITLCISVLPLTAWAATQISSVTITNVPTPYAGSKVPVAATVNTTGAQIYSMDWYDKTAIWWSSGNIGRMHPTRQPPLAIATKL